jgi:hypothetical protein
MRGITDDRVSMAAVLVAVIIHELKTIRKKK